jgi:hypothetical protein
MSIAAKLDDMGKPAWIALMVVSFIVFWPAGLAVLAYLIGSGRMACWKHQRRWQRGDFDEMRDRARDTAERWFGRRGHRSSGNAAFDEYRSETLRRLEEEEREFSEFLRRLRVAKDKHEFDEFLNQRRRRPEGPDAEPQPQA